VHTSALISDTADLLCRHGVIDHAHARFNCTNHGYLPCACARPVDLNSRPRTEDALVGLLDNDQFIDSG